MLTRFRQELAFAKNIPPRKILRRGKLFVQKKLEAQFRPTLQNHDCQRADNPPRPIMPSRPSTLKCIRHGWQFDQLGHAVEFGRTISWKLSGPPGRDQLWRMTLHYMEYCEGLDARCFTDVVQQWIAANPPYENGATQDSWNPYALSLRTVVWMQQVARRDGELPADFTKTVARSVAAQLVYLSRHLESDIGGNHLLKNIKALLWGGRFFTGKTAAQWTAAAQVLLNKELDRQFLPDGMHYELSPSYQCQVFADLLEIRQVLTQGSLATKLDAVLKATGQAIADMAHPDGFVAQFGDAGLHMAYSPADCLSAYRHMVGTVPTPNKTFGYDAGGYFGLRDGTNYFVIDAGRIAPDELPAHGHGDMFSFEWSVRGERLIVDQGVFQYVGSRERAMSRSARYHNTLHIEGMDQAEFFGAFRSAHRAEILHRTVEISAHRLRLDASHDGFVRYGGPVHSRKAIGSASRLEIRDQLDRPAPAPAQIGLLLHPNVAVQQCGTGHLLLSGAKARAAVKASHPLRIVAAVWWPDIGAEETTHRIILELPPGETESWIELSELESN